MSQLGIVIAVHKGGCEVVCGDEVRELQLLGRHARAELSLAVGDELHFDAEKSVVLDVLPRRTRLARLRPVAGRRTTESRREQVIAANVDQLAIVAAVADPPFRSGAVDRFLLAARAGGLEALLVANKIDLLGDAALPEEIEAYRAVLPVFPVSATQGRGLEPLRQALAGSRTVLAGHSGVGKSSLVNALEPELALATAEVRERSRKGRHTTTRASWFRLSDAAVVVDTPGVREIATGPVPAELLDEVYPDVAEHAAGCRFRDCRHDREPDCAVRAAIDAGELHPGRLSSYRKLREETAR